MTSRSLRIMIIDDEPCIRDSLQWYLEDLGYQVVVGPEPFNCDVYQGRDCCRKVSCTDVLLIDQHLPGMKGLDFVEALATRGCQGIRSNILLMSGDSTSIDLNKARELGITVVQKPMELDFLAKWLNEILS